ncbi:hypothetical protein HPB51_009631 [Rhipicephalus microplus]|uniref:Methyltransferase domain-containing protein n=1 Tax=Rhipicephalus microplus TaxID=6941 RepID=A0A9J6D8X8_RHIMP|nr:hypothetical protein HPB51_009631 [Rhipicephalus microplus]
MIENKEESMHRARERVKSLGLRNVVFYQSNINYYVGNFDLGVSLHACGVATDLVLQKCIERNAAFVSCPCCYGAMKVTDRISYPLSRAFRDTGISKEDYTLLCHYADRTERDTPTCQQGHYCMALVDRDRAMGMVVTSENPKGASASSSNDEGGSTSGQQDGSFECNICLDTAKDAVVSLCGHLFW